MGEGKDFCLLLCSPSLTGCAQLWRLLKLMSTVPWQSRTEPHPGQHPGSIFPPFATHTPVSPCNHHLKHVSATEVYSQSSLFCLPRTQYMVIKEQPREQFCYVLSFFSVRKGKGLNLSPMTARCFCSHKPAEQVTCNTSRKQK